MPLNNCIVRAEGAMPARGANLQNALRDALDRHGLTQKEFAQRAGTSQSAISKILDGQSSGIQIEKKILQTIAELDRSVEIAWDPHRFDAELRRILGQAVQGGLISDGELMTRLVQNFYSSNQISKTNSTNGSEFDPRKDNPFGIDRPENYDAMISYNSKDLHLAQALYNYLTTRQVPDSKDRLMIWIDYVYLEPGEDFVGELPAIISNVNLLISVVGPSGEGKWVPKEAGYAHSAGKPIIPVAIGKARFEDEFVRRTAPVVLSDEEDAEGLNRLFWAVVRRRKPV